VARDTSGAGCVWLEAGHSDSEARARGVSCHGGACGASLRGLLWPPSLRCTVPRDSCGGVMRGVWRGTNLACGHLACGRVGPYRATLCKNHAMCV